MPDVLLVACSKLDFHHKCSAQQQTILQHCETSCHPLAPETAGVTTTTMTILQWVGRLCFSVLILITRFVLVDPASAFVYETVLPCLNRIPICLWKCTSFLVRFSSARISWMFGMCSTYICSIDWQLIWFPSHNLLFIVGKEEQTKPNGKRLIFMEKC